MCLIWLNSTNTLNDSLSSSDRAVSSVKTVLIIQLEGGCHEVVLIVPFVQCQSTEKSAIIQASAAVFLRSSQGMLVV
jgi:hypothetical protein